MEAERQRQLEEQQRLLRIQRQLEEEQRRLAEEARKREAAMKNREAVMQKLRQVGNCPAGYNWTKQGGGWRCGGGSHFVSNKQLEEQFTHEVEYPELGTRFF